LSQQLEQFITYASSVTEFDTDEIRQVLRQRFGGYKRSEEGQYMALLTKLNAENILEEEKSWNKKRSPEPLCCPIHNVTVITHHRLMGPWTRTPGWRCPEGGLGCYIRWRINETRRIQGKEPITDWRIDEERREEA
jgi:hypothetical protein